MAKVYEVLPLEPFHEFELQAGESGLQNEITNVTMLDYETDVQDYSAFRAGDFILSSLYFAKDDEGLILETFRALAAKGISGFAIKTVYYFTVSDRLKRMADAAGVPVFTFHTTSMEDIIIAVSDLMKEQDQQSVHAGLLRKLLSGPKEVSAVASLAHELDEKLQPRCMALYAAFRQNVKNIPLPSRQTAAKVLHDEEGMHYSRFLYDGGILLILSARELTDEGACRARLLSKLEALRMSPGLCRIGFGQICETQRQLDICIQQAIYAWQAARMWEKDAVSYGELGIHRYLLPLLENRVCLETCSRDIALLERYDLENSTLILPTLTAFIRNEADFNRTAAELYLHPNTVRYRVQKARALLGEKANFYEQAFLCISLMLLRENP